MSDPTHTALSHSEPEPEAKRRGRPPNKSAEPEQDPLQGDKTPAYVEWYRENHSPEEFDAKYKGRKGTVLE